MRKLIRLAAVAAVGAVPVLVAAQDTWSTPRAINPDVLTDSVDDSQPKIAKDETGRAMVVWLRILDFEEGTPGTDVLSTVKSANGDTWSEPVLVNTDAATNEDVLTADIVYAGNSVWVSIWNDFDGSVWTARSTDTGVTWSDPIRVDVGGSVPDSSEAHISIASDGAGKIIATWVIGPTELAIVKIESTDFGVTWTTPAHTLPSVSGVDDSVLSYGGNGFWAHAYSVLSGASATVDFRYSVDNGITWSDSTNVWTWAGSAMRPLGDVEAFGNTVVVAYKQPTPGPDASSTLYVRVSYDKGETLQPAAEVGTVGLLSSISLSTDGEGTWIALAGNTPAVGDIAAYKSTDDGDTWTAIAAVATGASFERAFASVSLSPSFFTAIYQSNRTETGQFGSDDDIYEVTLGNAPPAAARDWALFE